MNSKISKFDDPKSSYGNDNSIIKVWIVKILETDGAMWFQELQLESGISINRFPVSKKKGFKNGHLNLKCRKKKAPRIELRRSDFTKQSSKITFQKQNSQIECREVDFECGSPMLRSSGNECLGLEFLMMVQANDSWNTMSWKSLWHLSRKMKTWNAIAEVWLCEFDFDQL